MLRPWRTLACFVRHGGLVVQLGLLCCRRALASTRGSNARLHHWIPCLTKSEGFSMATSSEASIQLQWRNGSRRQWVFGRPILRSFTRRSVISVGRPFRSLLLHWAENAQSIFRRSPLLIPLSV